MKLSLLCLFSLYVSTGLFAQEFEVPKNYTLETAEDYYEYEREVLNCINWILRTSIDDEPVKRRDANAFLLKWLTGSPYVHLEIRHDIVTFMGTSPDLLMIFLGGWAKHALESKDYDNKIDGTLAGIEAVIEFYDNNRDYFSRDRHIERYKRMQRRGTLRNFLEETL